MLGQARHAEAALLPLAGQGRASEDVEVVDFDPGYGQAGQEPGGLHEFCNPFAWQAVDHVGADSDFRLGEADRRLGEVRDTVAPVDPLQGGVRGGLEAEFHPEVGAGRILGEQLQDGWGQAVRSGPKGEAHHVRVVHGRVVEGPKPFGIGVGGAEVVEVGQEGLGLVAAAHPLDALAELLRHVGGTHVDRGHGGSAAEGAAAAALGAVPVRAGKPAPEDHALDPASEPGPEVGGQGPVAHGGCGLGTVLRHGLSRLWVLRKAEGPRAWVGLLGWPWSFWRTGPRADWR